MTIQRMGHVGVVVDDLEAAIAFFVERGLELGAEATVERRWVDRSEAHAQPGVAVSLSAGRRRRRSR